MVIFSYKIAMHDTIVSNEVANNNQLGCLVPLNSSTIDLKVVNPSSICVFMFGGRGELGFFMPLCACVVFDCFWVQS